MNIVPDQSRKGVSGIKPDDIHEGVRDKGEADEPVNPDAHFRTNLIPDDLLRKVQTTRTWPFSTDVRSPQSARSFDALLHQRPIINWILMNSTGPLIKVVQ